MGKKAIGEGRGWSKETNIEGFAAADVPYTLSESGWARNSREQNTSVAVAVAICKLELTPCKDRQAKHAIDVSEGSAEKGNSDVGKSSLVIEASSKYEVVFTGDG
jgi:hypothetical protein